jgi:acetyl esterase/lipase
MLRSPMQSLLAALVAAVCCLISARLAIADEPLIADDQIVLLGDLRYREGCKACTLDLAMQKDYQGPPRPALLVIHGGGWIEGDKSSFATATQRNPANIRDFARLGFVALGINYRLAREAPFPAGLDDCRAAVRWLRAHAAEYRVDPTRIGAYGNSAGGHLALLLALMPPEPAGPGEPLADQSSQVQAAASDSGPLDLLGQHRDNQLRGVVELFMGGPPERAGEGTYKKASPSSYVTGTVPPLLLIYGEVDGQVPVASADRFVAALSQAGAKDISYFRLAAVDHCPHSLIGVPYLRPVVNEFFLRTLKAKPRP